MPFSFPAQLAKEREHRVEIWLTDDLHFVTCVGIDSQGKRVCFPNESGETKWRLATDDWDEIMIKAWGDQHEVSVDVYDLEIHKTS
jgi:hypothetical protein